MSKYIAFSEYNGTRERTVALVLDHNLIFDSRSGSFTLLDPNLGLDGLVDRILRALDRAAEEAASTKSAPPAIGGAY